MQPGIAPKKLIFLDKPLPGEFMSARERIQIADRRSLLAMLTVSFGHESPVDLTVLN